MEEGVELLRYKKGFRADLKSSTTTSSQEWDNHYNLLKSINQYAHRYIQIYFKETNGWL